MLIEYLGSFSSPYWGWDVPWEVLIKVTGTRTLWKHSLFIEAISFCSNTLAHYRACLHRTIDPLLVKRYAERAELTLLKLNTFPPSAWRSGDRAACILLLARNEKQSTFHFPLVEGKAWLLGLWATAHFACLVFGVCCFCPFSLSGISSLQQYALNLPFCPIRT